MDAYQRVTGALADRGAKRSASGTWQCPAHEDRTPSLSVARGRDGRVLVTCHAGCEFAAIMAALGLDERAAFAEPERNGAGGRASISAVYPYRDEAGGLLFEVVRRADKSFSQRQARPEGGHAWNLHGVRRVIYRLPEVMAAVAAGRRVWIVEGEKDVAALERVGEVATCNPGGAGKWREEYSAPLRGAEVRVVRDRDEPGHAHAAQVVAALDGIARSVAVLDPATGKDAADHLSEGLGPDEFVTVSPGASDPSPDTWAPAADVCALASAKVEPPMILCAQDEGALVYRGMRHLVSGEPETLKSWIAAAAATELVVDGESVIWWDADAMGPGPLVERMEALGAGRDAISAGLLYLTPDRPFDEPARAILGRLISSRRVGLVVIDALNPALELHGLSPNSSAEVQMFLRRVVGFYHEQGIATLAIDHVTKDREDRGRWAYGSERKVGGVDVHISVELIGEPPTRSRPSARAILRAGKDRPGWHERSEGRRIGEFVLDLEGEPPWRLELGRGRDERPFRPTGLMERVSRHLELAGDGCSTSHLEREVTGRARFVRQAVRLLAKEGYAESEEASRGALIYRSTSPYREADDPLISTPSDPVPTPSRTGSEPVPPHLGGVLPPRDGTGSDGTGRRGDPVPGEAGTDIDDWRDML